MSNLKRRWDAALSEEDREIIRHRRYAPDGQQRYAEWDEVKGQYQYPWKAMLDGDYFVVKVNGSKESMKVLFRQTSARKDFEVVTKEIEVDGETCLMVTRIQGGMAALKDQVGVKRFDVEARRRYLTEHGKGKTTPVSLGKISVSEPTEPVVQQEFVTDSNKDFEEMKRLRILAAKKELAGVPVDEPDFMRVQKT